jgi:hypothetical protein
VNEVSQLAVADPASVAPAAEDWDEMEVRVAEVAVRVEHQPAADGHTPPPTGEDADLISSRLVLSGRASMQRRNVGFLDHADVQIMHAAVPPQVAALRNDAFGTLEIGEQITANFWLTQDDYRRITSGIDYAAEYRRPAITLRMRFGPRMAAVPTKGRYGVFWWGINVARIVGE